MTYDMPYSSDVPADVLSVMVGVFIVVGTIAAIIGIVFYIFEAISLYTIAKKRGIANPWISFIPIINRFMVGAIADNINAYINKRTNYRFFLLILTIVNQIMSIFYLVAYFGFLFKDGFAMMLENNSMYGQRMLPLMGLSGINSLVGIAFAVFFYISLYRIYADYNQRNAVLFLVLSILFGISPFFLFSLRNKPSASLYYAQQMQENAMRYQPYQQGNGYEQSNNTNDPNNFNHPNQ